MPLNRFGSALYLYQLFGVKLIWGVSNIYEETVPILKAINISNGIFDFLAMYGLAGLAFFLYRCFIFFRKFTESIELSVYGLIVILILGFSESIFSIPFTLCFFFLYYYSEPEISDNEIPVVSPEFLGAGEAYNVSGSAPAAFMNRRLDKGQSLKGKTIFGSKINLKLRG